MENVALMLFMSCTVLIFSYNNNQVACAICLLMKQSLFLDKTHEYSCLSVSMIVISLFFNVYIMQ
jgi:hypothetical protein